MRRRIDPKPAPCGTATSRSETTPTLDHGKGIVRDAGWIPFNDRRHGTLWNSGIHTQPTCHSATDAGTRCCDQAIPGFVNTIPG